MKPENNVTPEEHEMMKEVHDFLFKPPIHGKASRSEQVDEVLGAVRAGKLGTRVLLWLAGMATAFGAIWSGMFGVWK